MTHGKRVKLSAAQPTPLFSHIRFSMCYSTARDVLYLRQANYLRHVEVDYLDYDEAHYFRFRRVEKLLAS